MGEEDDYAALPTLDGPGSPDLGPQPWTRGERLLSALGRRRRLIAFILASLVLLPTLHLTSAGSAATQRLRSWREAYLAAGESPLRPPVAPPSGRCPSILDPPRPLVPALGEAADATYDGIGSVCLPDYKEELATFLKRAFPARDADAGDPESILSSVSRYLNSTLVHVPVDAPERTNASPALAGAIPQRIHQTVQYIDAQWTSMTQSWPSFHPAPGWQWQLSDDGMMDAWVRETFRATTARKGSAKQRLGGQEVTWLLSMWRRLESTPVMRADLWRYLKLLKEGGIYSDADTQVIKDFGRWSVWDGRPAGGDDLWAGVRDGRRPPSVIIGIEEDVGNRHDWHDWWPRPLSISQWTFAAAPGHPILLDTVRHVMTSLSFHFSGRPSRPIEYIDGDVNHGTIPSIVDLTGPGAFTDAVMRYLGVITEGAIRWADLRGLPEEGRRIGDVLVLPMTAFSPGVGHSGAGDMMAPGAFVAHSFLGSWKHNSPPR